MNEEQIEAIEEFEARQEALKQRKERDERRQYN